MRVAFLGSPPFGTPSLRALLASRHETVAAVTRRPRRRGRGRREAASEVVELARAAGVPVLAPESARDPAFQRELAARAAEVALVASYGEILDEGFLELFPRGALNVHPSLLPRHRGATPIPAAILAGDERTGVSIQRIVRELDAGDVALQREVAIEPDETAAELAPRLAELGAACAVEVLDRLAEGTARFVPQDPSRATRCRKLRREDARIDWSRPATELARLVRAANPWPVAHTELPGGAELAVLRARPTACDGSAPPGAVLRARDRLVVACGEGALELLEVRAAGRRPLVASAFLAGARLEAGARLGSAG